MFHGALLLALGLLAMLELGRWHQLATLDNQVGDAMLRWHAKGRLPPDDVVLIDIDQGSLKNLQMLEVAGAWSWPRVIHAELINALAAQQPRAIVLDLILSSPDRLRPENDAELARALAFQRAFVPIVLMPDAARQATLSMAPPAMGIRALAGADPAARYGIEGPSALPAEVWRTGYINFLRDEDGIGRRAETGRQVGGWWIPHILGRVADALHWPQPGDAAFRLNWYGREFTRIPYAQAYLATQIGDRRLPFDPRGKTIVIGATASGLLDFVPTPMDATTPGSFLLATGLANLQNDDWLRPAPGWASPLLALLLITATGWAFWRRVSPAWMLAAGAVVAVLVLMAALLALRAKVYWVPASALSMGALALLGFGLLSSRLEMAQRRHVQAMFSRFVDPRIVERLSDTAQEAQAEVSASREITVLFSDIRGFTSLSEHRRPQEIVAILNRYFEMQVEVIFRHQGTLDKFIGDAIMAFWGAPVPQTAHAVLAVRAALEMCEALRRFGEEMARSDPTARFDIGIGVHTGEAVVGFLGTACRLDYTAIGDTVNLSSRIEGCTKGVARVLVSEATRRQCGDAFDFADRGDFEVKGRAQTVRLYEPSPRMGGSTGASPGAPIHRV